jgi:predicted lipoprotein with Yx(FWY)xxD motif
MKKTTFLLALSLVLILGLSSAQETGGAETGGAETGGAETGGAGQATTAATLQVSENEMLGAYLTDGEGRTLYLFVNEEAEDASGGETGGQSTTGMMQNTLPCTDECAEEWPPFLTEGDPIAGEGVDASLLGTTTRDDGSVQVTYNGWPLYYYHDDEAPSDTKGQGIEPPAEDAFGGSWYVVSPEGNRVESEEAGMTGGGETGGGETGGGETGGGETGGGETGGYETGGG